MAVTAWLEAARLLPRQAPAAFALRTLDRLLGEAWDGEAALDHVIAYAEPAAAAEKIAGTLDDYAFTVHACIDAWQASGAMRYYRAAVQLADALIARFHDAAGGGFFDTATLEGTALGALAVRRKPLQDSPTPAGNPVAAAALLRLGALSGRRDFRDLAEETLAAFAGIAPQLGLFAASYGLALERLLRDPVQVVLVGSGAAADELEAAAQTHFSVQKTVLRIDPARIAAGELPEALAETLRAMPPPAGAEAAPAAWALVCRGHACLPPLRGSEELRKALDEAI